MFEIMDQLRSSENSSSILENFNTHLATKGENKAIYENLTQRFLIVKLDYGQIEMTKEDVKAVWSKVDERFHEGLLTDPPVEESKEITSNIHLVGIIDKL